MSTKKLQILCGNAFQPPIITNADFGWMGWTTRSDGVYQHPIRQVEPNYKVDIQVDAEAYRTISSSFNTLWVENDNGILRMCAMGDMPNRDFSVQLTMTPVKNTSSSSIIYGDMLRTGRSSL